MSKLKYLFFLCIAFILIGCANQMALIKGQEKIDLSKKSIALLSLKISNQNKPEYQPHPWFVYIHGKSNLSYAVHTYGGIYDSQEPYRSKENSFNEYLLSFDLEPGINNLFWINCQYQGMFIRANAALPLNLNVDIKPNSINYLGHIDAVIRERKNDDEARAGAVIPLVDQAVSGFSSSTFDVTIEDKFEEDMKSFTTEYPGLQKCKIEKNILPKWVRPENMKKD